MANQYTITITNQSNSPQAFSLFQEVPAPAHSAGDNVFTNIYLSAGTIQSGPNSNAKFSMQTLYYAIYGTTSKAADGSTRVDTSDSIEAKLGPSGTYVAITADGNGNPSFDKTAMAGQSVATSGAFTVATDTTIQYPNPRNIYFGIGAKDPQSGKVVPIQTYIAKGGMNQQLFPKAIYYVCYGDFQPGTIVDRQGVGQVLTVDFTNASLKDALFTLNNHGSYVDGNVPNSGIVFTQGKLST